MNGSETAVQVVVEFDKGLFDRVVGECGPAGWNRYVADLMALDLIPPTWTAGERPGPIGVMLDFRGLRRAHYHLDGIDLSLCWLADANFEGASLRGAKMGCCPRASFKGARLNGADFRDVEISGCDFTGCLGLDTAMFEGAAYDPGNPPIGLSPELMALFCKAEAEPPPTDPRKPADPTNPAEPTGFRQAPLRCCATIHVVPIGE